MLNIYLINLANRTDRLGLMKGQLDMLGLSFKRIDAVLGSRFSPSDVAPVHRTGPLGELAPGDIGCFLSHRKAWQAICDENAPYGLILEDDVILGERFKAIVNSISEINIDFDILKLDRHGNSKHVVLLGSKANNTGVGEFRRLLSKHTGGGAYIITRDCAARALMASSVFDVSVDHFLFNPNNSRFFRDIIVQQLNPAAVKQGLIANDTGDIHKGRVSQRTHNFQYWKRELIRGIYEISSVPSIIWNFMLGARFKKIKFIP